MSTQTTNFTEALLGLVCLDCFILAVPHHYEKYTQAPVPHHRMFVRDSPLEEQSLFPPSKHPHLVLMKSRDEPLLLLSAVQQCYSNHILMISVINLFRMYTPRSQQTDFASRLSLFEVFTFLVHLGRPTVTCGYQVCYFMQRKYLLTAMHIPRERLFVSFSQWEIYM